MMDTLIEWDKALFIWLNAKGHPHLDSLMIFLSAKRVWIPLYLGLIYLLYRHYGTQFWKPLLLVLAAVGLSNFVTSEMMKPFFERLRPCKDPTLEGLIVVLKCGGKYGFASSHAANTFALASFYFALNRNRAYILLLVWAALVSYSRIHLGVHFPGDILVGGLIGAFFGWAGAKVATKWMNN